jgi:hypothetical protein
VRRVEEFGRAILADYPPLKSLRGGFIELRSMLDLEGSKGILETLRQELQSGKLFNTMEK